ncbi:hypothetical protein [Streptomyces sp. NPDC096324]|uniref:hypothetical protein n=1 Tax=Streptomyces sp. NPDC096324 TaxID=3366085 RepID=UPI003821B951
MPEPADLPIQDRYAQQLATDLEANRAQQALLAERLQHLRADEAFLVGLQSSVPARQDTPDVTDTAAPVPPAAQDATAVPSPRIAAASASDQSAKKAVPRRAAKKTAVKKTAEKVPKKTAEKAPQPTSGQPPLGALLQQILADQSEPRTAAELVIALEQEHPERVRDVNTVRNTVERLVAKSFAERSKQGSTVYYTSTQNAGRGAAETDAAPSSDSEGADASEKVPAPV